jgi:hypothetical protein
LSFATRFETPDALPSLAMARRIFGDVLLGEPEISASTLASRIKRRPRFFAVAPTTRLSIAPLLNPE